VLAEAHEPGASTPQVEDVITSVERRPRRVRSATAGPVWLAVTFTVPTGVPSLLYPVKVATTSLAQAAVTCSVVTVNTKPGGAVMETGVLKRVKSTLGWLVTPLV
jgi:hypothetical protein